MASNSPFSPGSTVAFYLRDSGGQEQECSIDQQEHVLREWAISNGLEVGQVFADSVSGTSTKGRENFLRMMGYFQHGPPEAGVVVWRSNRFGRNVDDAQYFKADLRRRGYLVFSITDNIPEGPAGKLYEFVLDWKDEIFSAQLSEDVKRGLSDLVRQYGAVPGTPPRGFMRVPLNIGTRRSGEPHIVHQWRPDPAQVGAIRRAFEMRARGASLRMIQDETKFYKNKTCWVTFFSNPIYKGVLKFGDQTIENYCDPVVTPELWDAANLTGQKRRHDPERQSQARRVSSSFLLSGLCRCQKCGGLMSGKVILKWRYYACSRRLATHECDARHVPAEPFENQIMENLKEHIITPENLVDIQSRLITQYELGLEDLKQQSAELQRRLANQNRSIGNLTAAIAEHGASQAIAKALREHEVEAASLREKINQLAIEAGPPEALECASLEDIAAQLVQVLEESEVEQKRYYLSAFVQEITVQRNLEDIRAVIKYFPPMGILCQPDGQLWGHSCANLSEYAFSYSSPAPKGRMKPR